MKQKEKIFNLKRIITFAPIELGKGEEIKETYRSKNRENQIDCGK